jgi:hypothetical protein
VEVVSDTDTLLLRLQEGNHGESVPRPWISLYDQLRRPAYRPHASFSPQTIEMVEQARIFTTFVCSSLRLYASESVEGRMI